MLRVIFLLLIEFLPVIIPVVICIIIAINIIKGKDSGADYTPCDL